MKQLPSALEDDQPVSVAIVVRRCVQRSYQPICVHLTRIDEEVLHGVMGLIFRLLHELASAELLAILSHSSIKYPVSAVGKGGFEDRMTETRI
jgi:hypothetical protein